MERRSIRPLVAGALTLLLACSALSRAQAQAPAPTPTDDAETSSEDETPPEPVSIVTTTLVGRVEAETRRPVPSEEPEAEEREEPRPDWMSPELTWEAHWGRSGIPNFVMIGVAAVTALVDIGVGPRRDSPTRGGWLFDEDVRSALRLSTEVERRFARDASDVLLTLMTSFPALVDSVTVAAWLHGSPDVATEMVLMNAEVVAVTFALQSTLNVAVSRERPYGRTCGAGGPDDLPETAGYCETSNRFFSFFSGHSSQSFASAALTCMHHLNLDLYGGGPIEMAPCAAGFVLAAATATLRVVGDMHYATDILTGAVIGTATGFLVPYLLHYHDGPPTARGTSRDDAVRVTVTPTPTGVQVFGVF
jgi:membrane-associated phospholipid phosphatase